MVLIGLILILPALGSAEETAAPKRARAATAKESEAARRQRLEDLERRVRALEQQYEVKEPEMPAPDAAPPSRAEK
jgi:hypothetical protein